jgi:hypothetical protein
MNKSEHERNEKQGCKGSDGKAADDGPSKRRILFSTLSDPESHRQHADDHRGGSHDDGSKSGMTGRDDRVESGASTREPFIRERNEKDRIGGCHSN